MTDEQLDRRVRDADPYRPEVVAHLDGVAQNLLEEIMSTPVLESVTEPPGQRRSRPRRRLMSGLASAGIAAAILGVVFGTSILKTEQPGSHEASPETNSTSEAPGTTTYSAMVLKAAEENPRLLIDQPGWKATHVDGFAERAGSITYSNGGRSIRMSWYQASEYDGRYKDRLQISKPESVQVDRWPGHLFRYSEREFEVILQPRDGSMVEVRTATAYTRADFDRVLASVIRVDARTWLAALPAEIVTPERLDERRAAVLADVPLPPGFDPATVNVEGVNDSDQFGIQVLGPVGCAWITEWTRAKKSGDDAALRRAADALRSSHNWKALQQIDKGGYWADGFWEIADTVAAGKPIHPKMFNPCNPEE
ncbi:hypothetical protein C7C45_10360 [Micromonospora arborensis]|uniref:Uncharacterized protein n=1 Tax=Micromonospora arborensis TaxID=2116518 RepID=A0A318NQ94_9ACTN|nr:hypothetical protein [Micromonospora arborensis]PYC72020.1 hypothetical protein C7C45_10360 [Micromonospora arborensis]